MSDTTTPDTQVPPPRRAWMALVALLAAQAMANMDNSIVNVASKTIREDLGASGGSLQSILAGYTLVFGILVVTGARLGDDKGYRRMFLTGLAGFVFASLLCGAAPNSGALALARAVQGGMGALMVPQILSSVQTMFSGRHLARAIGYYSMILALGVAAGQILGGLIVGANLFGYSWRVAFLLNVPVGVAVWLLARAYLPSGDPKRGVRLDLVGVLVLGVSMALLVLPIMFGRDQGWPLWAWLSLLAGTLGLAVFVRYERRLIARNGRPLLDLRALRPRGARPGILALCLLNFSFAGILFPLTLHLQTALGYAPIQAGLMFIPYPVGFAVVSLTWTRLPQPWHARLPVIGLVLFAAAAATLLAIVHTGWSVGPAAVVLLVAGAGMAASMSPLINQVAVTVGPGYASAVSALLSTGTLLFSVLSIATAGGLYLSFAERSVTRSATGVSWAFALVSGMLLLATACAARIWHVAVRPASPAGMAEAEPVVEEAGA